MNKEVRFDFLDNESQRLDKFLTTCLKELTRSRIQVLIRDGCVRVNGQKIIKTGYSLEKSMQVTVNIPLPAPIKLQAENIPLNIVFENEGVLVINKPAGMVVHPSAGHVSNTLVNAVLAHEPFFAEEQQGLRPGIVHRLDKDTSGLIIVAKNEKNKLWLQEQFSLRKVEKYYLALVDGKPRTRAGRIEASIYRDPSHRQRMAIAPLNKGRLAVTEYSTLQEFQHHTLLKVRILTGRTHQIRVHLSSLGCPVVGDVTYGHKNPSLPIKRQFLHAYQMKIKLLGDEKPHEFQAELPNELQTILDSMK